MSQVFHPRSNSFARISLFALLLLFAGVGVAVFGFQRADYVTRVSYAIDQPVPFSHEHHVGGLGIDCRVCHTVVEESPFAGMPSTETCMQCHAQIWTNAQVLEPVRESWRTGKPLEWNRVHDLPDFVYFDHSIHIAKGVGCVTCHGQVDQMPLIQKTVTLHMSWCLECHRAPENFIRPREHVFDMNWHSNLTPAQQRKMGLALKEQYAIPEKGMTNCTACHR